MPVASSTPRGRSSGIQKRRFNRADRDGDVVMGAGPKVTPTRTRTPNQKNNSSLTELKVTGWTDEDEVPRLLSFLEKHAARRSPNATKGSSAPRIIIKSRHEGKSLFVRVLPENVVAFRKINGFSFASHTHGSQQLTIEGPGITTRRSASPPTNNTTESGSGAGKAETNNTIQQFKGFLERRYDPGTKLLNLSEMASDVELAKLGMFDTASRQEKLFPVLTTIIDTQLKTPDQKREAFHSITLSKNSLPNLNMVKTLSHTLPHIKNLDLSSNKFASTKDLLAWKRSFHSLEHLIVSDNPFTTSQPGWEKELISWYPNLRFLNNQQVRTDADFVIKRAPVPATTTIWQDTDKVAENFLIEFVQGFDQNREAIIQKYYDNSSTFTLSVNTQTKGGTQHITKPWDSYLPMSRNLKFINNKRPRFNRRHVGQERIFKAFSQMPPTRHPGFDTNKYIVDCQLQPGVPDPTGQYAGVTGLLVTLHGEYEEHRTAKGANEVVPRAFDRTFILGPGGATGVRVVSDLLALRAGGGIPAWIPQEAPQAAAPAPTTVASTTPAPPVPAATNQLSPEQQAMVELVQRETKMTTEYSIHCLEAGNWNIQAAAEIFTAQRASLPAEAFMTTA